MYTYDVYTIVDTNTKTIRKKSRFLSEHDDHVSESVSSNRSIWQILSRQFLVSAGDTEGLHGLSLTVLVKTDEHPRVTQLGE